jgi:hypothetical protein
MSAISPGPVGSHLSFLRVCALEAGAPSADVLDRIARALMLTDVEREHLFLLGLGRPPEVRYKTSEGVTPRLQRVLDALEFSPAVVSTIT